MEVRRLLRCTRVCFALLPLTPPFLLSTIAQEQEAGLNTMAGRLAARKQRRALGYSAALVAGMAVGDTMYDTMSGGAARGQAMGPTVSSSSLVRYGRDSPHSGSWVSSYEAALNGGDSGP